MFKRLLLVFCFFFTGLTSVFAQNNDSSALDSLANVLSPKRILLLYSKERSNERIREFSSGFSSYLSNNKIYSGIINLYLDPNGERSDEEKLGVLNRSRNTVFAQNKIDLIIATDSEAYEFLNTADSLEPFGIPIMCVYLEKQGFEPKSNISRIVTTIPIEENIRLGLDLFPNTKDILFIFDDSKYGEIEEAYTREVADMFQGKVNMTYLTSRGMAFSEFMNKIGSFPLNSFIILSTWQLDSQGNYRAFKNFFPFMSRLNNIPVFGIQNLSLGTGILGGYVVSSWDQGYKAAETSQKVLSTPGYIINDTLRDYRLSFDFNLVKRWNIPKENLPEGAQIINKPPSLYEDFKTEFQFLMAFIVLLLTSLLVFTVYHIRYRNLNQELHKSTRESAQRQILLKNTLSVMNEGVVTFDPDLNIIDANKAAVDMSEHISIPSGKKFREMFYTTTQNDENSIESLLKQSLETKCDVGLKDFTRIDYKERESKFISGNISPIIENGIVSQLVLVMRDVTEFNKKQRYLSLALDSAKSFIWFYNAVTKQFSISENFENIFGPKRSGFSSHFQFLEIVHPDDKKRLSVAFENMLAQKIKRITVEYRLSVDGEENWQWWERRGIIYSDDGNSNDIRFFYGMDINIDSLKRRESDILEAKLKAEESDRLKSAFLSNMSHEIRTPLNGIVGFAALLSDAGYSDEERKEFTRIINTNSKILMTLIGDILDLSRIESDSMIFEFSEFDICQQIKEAIEINRLSLAAGVELISDLPNNSLIVNADPQRNAQLLNNLINNAIKFTARGKIVVGYKENDTLIEVFVKDTGKGIKEELQTKIFDRFYKGDEFISGTGLGLPICKAIAQKFGGEIRLESKPGAGTTFFYTLTKASGAGVISKTIEDLPVAENGDTKPTVLVAEDLDSNFLLIEIILSKKYSVIRANNGKEAISLYLEHKPDLIFMDIKMPVMDGLEATRELRKFSTSIPIIALTANAFESDQIEAKEAGCNEVITKPVKSSLLILVAEKYLKSKR